MMEWLPVFRIIIERLGIYDLVRGFGQGSMIGPVYGGGEFVRAIKRLSSGETIELRVGVWDRKVAALVGKQEIFAACSSPDNMCQEELEEALMEHFGI